MHTVNITSGYRWDQNAKSVILYLRIVGANEIDDDRYTLDVKSRSIHVYINNHRNANYSFKINKLCGQLEPQGTKIKFQGNKVIITLQKKDYGKHWNDIKEKSIHEVYSQMQRKLRDEDIQGGYSNGYREQKKAFGNSDPSTCQAASNLLSNQQGRPGDFVYSLDPFHISGIIPSTSSQSASPHSHNDDKDP